MTRAVITVTGTSTDARGFPTLTFPARPTLIFWSNIWVY